MKLLKIIYKNLKLLMRSKLSSFIIVFGPLIIMLLVGVSFNRDTTEFNLNLGVYAKEKTPLIQSFIDKLNSENYIITEFSTSGGCVDEIKYGEIHTCIVFPDEFEVRNNQKNLVKVYVDQSKINLVYLVLGTIQQSFSNRSEEISLDLTSQILTVHSENQESLNSLLERASELESTNNKIDETAGSASASLGSLDLSYEMPEEDNGSLADVLEAVEQVREEILELVGDSLDNIEELEEYGLDENQSAMVEDVREDISDINSTIRNFHQDINKTIIEFSSVMESFKKSIEDMAEKLSSTQKTNTQVIEKLNAISAEAGTISTKISDIRTLANEMSLRIGSIQVTEAENIVKPVSTEVEQIVKQESNLSFMFPVLVVLLIMFIGLILPALLFIIEKNSKASFRVFLTPTSDFSFTLAHYLTGLLLLFVQLIVILSVSEYYFKMDLFSSWKNIAIVLFIVSTMFTLAGMLIGLLFHTEEMATLAGVSVGSLFLLTSGLIFPLESMPRSIIQIAKLNPFLIASEVFKKTLLFQTPLQSMKTSVLLLLGYSIAILVVIVIIQRLSQIRILHTKYTQMQKEKKRVMALFVLNDKEAETLEEFTHVVSLLAPEIFDELKKNKEFSKWISLVLEDKKLARQIRRAKGKQEVLNILTGNNQP